MCCHIHKSYWCLTLLLVVLLKNVSSLSFCVHSLFTSSGKHYSVLVNFFSRKCSSFSLHITEHTQQMHIALILRNAYAFVPPFAVLSVGNGQFTTCKIIFVCSFCEHCAAKFTAKYGSILVKQQTAYLHDNPTRAKLVQWTRLSTCSDWLLWEKCSNSEPFVGVIFIVNQNNSSPIKDSFPFISYSNFFAVAVRHCFNMGNHDNDKLGERGTYSVFKNCMIFFFHFFYKIMIK